jgi:pantetheine-phosphate adenylyltransferase
MATTERTAVCPGSYDPVTNGHLDVIARAAQVFDHIIVAVVNLPIRKGKTLFDIGERVDLIETAIKDLGIENVSVKPFSTLIVDFAREQGAVAIVKGLRAISDFEYEFEMNQLNRQQAPDIESFYVMSSPQFSFVSSSGIKELVTFGGKITGMVPPNVAERLQQELSR